MSFQILSKLDAEHGLSVYASCFKLSIDSPFELTQQPPVRTKLHLNFQNNLRCQQHIGDSKLPRRWISTGAGYIHNICYISIHILCQDASEMWGWRAFKPPSWALYTRLCCPPWPLGRHFALYSRHWLHCPSRFGLQGGLRSSNLASEQPK